MAAHKEVSQIDQKLYFEVFATQTRPKTKAQATAQQNTRT
jgi:hypothetical protein